MRFIREAEGALKSSNFGGQKYGTCSDIFRQAVLGFTVESGPTVSAARASDHGFAKMLPPSLFQRGSRRRIEAGAGRDDVGFECVRMVRAASKLRGLANLEELELHRPRQFMCAKEASGNDDLARTSKSAAAPAFFKSRQARWTAARSAPVVWMFEGNVFKPTAPSPKSDPAQPARPF